MNILIDESLPRKLKLELPGHNVSTVPEMGWAGKKNGELLRLMSAQFDVFITIDGNLHYQQNLSDSKTALIVLSALNNKLETLKPLMAQVLSTLQDIEPGQLVVIGQE